MIRDSFFCPNSASGEVEVCCPFDGIEPAVSERPGVDDRGKIDEYCN
jgi:hypothetical protein